MSDTDGLSDPGTSIYSSSTLYVGDGTWDSNRNSFLLPNLMGLNFDTMQYNGMGNRFRDLPQYHSLILGHGVVAAIVFIVIVPAAIFTAKYGHWNRQSSYKLHIYLQILTVFLTTVVLVLGWFAVGPNRSLTNPHHGIGVAIYTLVLFQFIYGWCMSKRERKRKVIPRKIPLSVWLHKLLGRSIAILGFVQLALGLTLYGSPKALFVLYALVGFLLIFAYLALDYYYKDRIEGPAPAGGHQSGYYSDYGSYISGTQATQDHRRRDENRSHWGRNILAGAGALGVYEAYKHRRERKRQEREDGRVNTVGGYDTPGRPRPPRQDESVITPLTPSRQPGGGRHDNYPPNRPYGDRPYRQDTQLSEETWENEKYDSPEQRHTWRNRLLGAGAGIAALEGARRMFGRKNRKDEENYRPPLGGAHAPSQADVSRVDAGHASYSPDDPRRRHDLDSVPLGESTMTPVRPSRHRLDGAHHGEDDYDEESYYEDNRPHTLRDSIATFGALGGFREWMSQRRHRRDQTRTNRLHEQDDLDAQRYDRRTSSHYPRPSDGRLPSESDTVFTGTTHEPHAGTGRPDSHHPPLPLAAAAAIPAAAVAGAALTNRHEEHSTHVTDNRHDVRHGIQGRPPQGSRVDVNSSQYVLPPPPSGPAPAGPRPPPVPGSAFMPEGAVEPDPNRLLAMNTAANEGSAYGRTHVPEAAAAGLAAGMLAGRATGSGSPARYGSRERPIRPTEVTASSSGDIYPPPGTTGSPPVSLKVKMHNDSGGHVTLRRLNEEEAAAERAARRRDRRQRPRRGSSLSSGLDDEIAQRYRRNGPIVPSASQPISNVPPPPAMSSAAGSGRRDSELNLPPMPPGSSPPVVGRPPVLQGSSPPIVGRPPYPNASGSGLINPVSSPGPYTTDAGTGTDVSAFDEARRRRRAARRQGNQNNRVEFE